VAWPGGATRTPEPVPEGGGLGGPRSPGLRSGGRSDFGGVGGFVGGRPCTAPPPDGGRRCAEPVSEESDRVSFHEARSAARAAASAALRVSRSGPGGRRPWSPDCSSEGRRTPPDWSRRRGGSAGSGRRPCSPDSESRSDAGRRPCSPDDSSPGRRPCSPDDSGPGRRPCSPDDSSPGRRPCSPDSESRSDAGRRPCSPDDSSPGRRPCSLDDSGPGRRPDSLDGSGLTGFRRRVPRGPPGGGSAGFGEERTGAWSAESSQPSPSGSSTPVGGGVLRGSARVSVREWEAEADGSSGSRHSPDLLIELRSMAEGRTSVLPSDGPSTP
jgi:hypothetical protein